MRLIATPLLLALGLSGCSLANWLPEKMDHSQMKDGDMAGMEHGAWMEHGAGMDHSMDLGPADADYDLRFIDAMTPHHEGAVVMAQDALEKSKRPEIRALSEGILAAQAQEISEMQAWRKAWYPQADETPMAWHPEMNHMMPMTAEQAGAMRMDMDLGAADADYDRRFLQAMIPHHQAAVTMAEDLAQKTQRPELKELARAIASSQQAEIDQMEQWLKAWYP